MIDAKEAKRLYDESGAEVTAWLNSEVSKKVEDAAKSGKRNVFIFLGSEELWKHPTLTPIQKRCISALIDMEYRAEFKVDDETYVPRGLADDEGNGPKYRNYGIMVSW